MTPIYSFECPEGHRTVRMRRVQDASDPVDCEECGARADRVIDKTARPVVKDGTPMHHGG